MPGSSTESTAIANVEYEQERIKYLEWVVRAVNRLTYAERYDYDVYLNLNMSERNYYRIKSRIFYKLAFALKVEVYEEVAN